MSEAPGLFAYDSENHCYVARQPRTKTETDRMVFTVWAAELQCIRYRGRAPELLRRFAELGEPHICDTPPPADIQAVCRNHVTFEAACETVESMTASQLAVVFQEYLRSTKRDGLTYRFTQLTENREASVFSYAWFRNHLHAVEFRRIDFPACRWLVRHFSAQATGGRGVSRQLHDWLENDDRFCGIRWYTETEWEATNEWQETPW